MCMCVYLCVSVCFSGSLSQYNTLSLTVKMRLYLCVCFSYKGILSVSEASLSNTWEILRYMGLTWCSCSWIRVREWEMTHLYTRSLSDTLEILPWMRNCPVSERDFVCEWVIFHPRTLIHEHEHHVSFTYRRISHVLERDFECESVIFHSRTLIHEHEHHVIVSEGDCVCEWGISQSRTLIHEHDHHVSPMYQRISHVAERDLVYEYEWVLSQIVTFVSVNAWVYMYTCLWMSVDVYMYVNSYICILLPSYEFTPR